MASTRTDRGAIRAELSDMHTHRVGLCKTPSQTHVSHAPVNPMDSARFIQAEPWNEPGAALEST